MVPDIDPATPNAEVDVQCRNGERAGESRNRPRYTWDFSGILVQAGVLEIYATGASLLSPSQATVIAGGVQTNVLYFGPSGFAGVEQINVLIPQGVRGPAVPVVIRTAGGDSNITVVSIP